jgi:hypothetical protein
MEGERWKGQLEKERGTESEERERESGQRGGEKVLYFVWVARKY